MRNMSCTSLAATAVVATSWISSTALAQVANDECATAQVVASGSTTAFDTTSATTSLEAVDETQCANTFPSWGTANKDVWFLFNAPESGLLTVSTCLAGSFDTTMFVYVGTCGALTQVACNGDGLGGTGCQAYYSRIQDIQISAAGPVYIRVGGYTEATGLPNAGPGSLTVDFSPLNAGCLGSTAECGVVHAAPGCSDPVCCSAVCAANPICCETGWDQSCVDGAVAACGIFIYQCQSPVYPNDCATNPTIVSSDSSIPFNCAGANLDGPPEDPANVCQSGNTFFYNDLWYRVKAIANGNLTASTCDPSLNFDTKLAIYDLGTADPSGFNYNTLPDVMISCNDYVACNEIPPADPSRVIISAQINHYYLIRVATFLAAGSPSAGLGKVIIDVPEPCTLPVQSGFESEACGSNSNNGCLAAGETQDIVLGSRIRGTFWSTVDPANSANLIRDVDFYKLVVTQDAAVTVNLFSASNVVGYIFSGNIATAGCAGISQLAAVAGSCPASATACLNPGTYYVFVAPAFSADLACGSGVFNDYVLELTSAPANCPDVVDQVCANPGANTFALDNGVTNSGQVSCAGFGAAPNCQLGGNVGTSYARVIPAGSIGGSLTCWNFGIWSTRRGLNTTTGACGYYYSDIPLLVTVGLYEDMDGADPRGKILATGDGNDLRLIAERQVLCPGGVYMANIDFDPPLCLSGTNGPIVAVMDVPDTINAPGVPNAPGNQGYNLRPGGSTVTGQTSFGFWAANGCGGTPNAFVPLASNFTVQWNLSFQGNFAGCAAPCPTDLNGDHVTGSADLSVLLNAWGGTSPDLNGDGVVGSADLSVILNAWGACP